MSILNNKKLIALAPDARKHFEPWVIDAVRAYEAFGRHHRWCDASGVTQRPYDYCAEPDYMRRTKCIVPVWRDAWLYPHGTHVWANGRPGIAFSHPFVRDGEWHQHVQPVGALAGVFVTARQDDISLRTVRTTPMRNLIVSQIIIGSKYWYSPYDGCPEADRLIVTVLGKQKIDKWLIRICLPDGRSATCQTWQLEAT